MKPTAEEFLEFQYGITLTEEKALIHPQMLIKAMEEFASAYAAAVKSEPAEGAEEILNKSGLFMSPGQGRVIIKAMTEFAALHAQRLADKMVEERIKIYEELLIKQTEYIEAQDKQIKLITGDLPLIDCEGFGYHALAISQELTRIERELNELRSRMKGESK